MSNLRITLKDVTESLFEGVGVDIIYLDYSKAMTHTVHTADLQTRGLWNLWRDTPVDPRFPDWEKAARECTQGAL